MGIAPRPRLTITHTSARITLDIMRCHVNSQTQHNVCIKYPSIQHPLNFVLHFCVGAGKNITEQLSWRSAWLLHLISETSHTNTNTRTISSFKGEGKLRCLPTALSRMEARLLRSPHYTTPCKPLFIYYNFVLIHYSFLLHWYTTLLFLYFSYYKHCSVLHTWNQLVEDLTALILEGSRLCWHEAILLILSWGRIIKKERWALH